MFKRRLKWFAVLLGLVACAVIVRLVDIQVLHASDYEALSERMLARPVRYLPAPRGGIFDRAGRPLAADEPSFDISVHYAVLAGRSDYLAARARELRRRGEYPATMRIGDIVDDFRVDITHMWQRLSALTGQPIAAFMEKAEQVRERVERVRASVERRTGYEQPITEEAMFHPLLESIDNELAMAVQLELTPERYPWLRVGPAARRTVRDADALVHVLGRVGEATQERIDADPFREDELAGLRPGDRCGSSGAERAYDYVLRGRRGRIVEDSSRQVVEEVAPERGRDVYLTIDLALQHDILAMLQEAAKQSEHPRGAAAVVLDATTREVLALVSCPTYDYERFQSDYGELQRDTRMTPLLFRAVAAQYPPGSICKAITLIGALSERVISENARIHCTGALLKDNPNAFRCWIYNQYNGLTHDAMNPTGMNAEDAVRNSCNIYFYTIGERLGAERLCGWFSRLGLGRTQGTGLIEESPGIVPSEAWLRRRLNRGHQASDAWNYAIGQGEVTCTPLQAANVAASAATGRWAPVKLARDENGTWLGQDSRPEGRGLAERDRATRRATRPEADESAEAAVQTFDGDALRVLRSGMWRVVNERGGTGYAARLDVPGYEMCGKTGSAQAVPTVITRKYTLEWPDGRREDVIAHSAEDALAPYGDDPPQIAGSRAAERYPNIGPDDKLPSHAWFIGYTQPTTTRRGAAPQGRVYALAVLIEYGGGGGRVAGPVAKRIAERLLRGEDVSAAARP